MKMTHIYNKVCITAMLLWGACTAMAQLPVDELELPTIPSELRKPEQRAGYLLKHFWDNADFQSDPRMGDSLFMEQNFVNFLSVMPHAAQTDREAGMNALMTKAATDRKVSERLGELAEEYLYSPASPMRDERLYVTFLQSRAAATPEDADGIRSRELAAELSKNMPGCTITDIDIELSDGSTTTLSAMFGRPILLLLYDPDCSSCHTAMAALGPDKELSAAIEAGRVTVVAVAVDTDRETWTYAKDTLPSGWVSALDLSGVNENELYYLPQMPGLYLIDADAIVTERNIPAATASGHANPAILKILLGENIR
ncbi:MAG: DUF5106 domain-containing protein [Muribaculaceae bacterium]|nr:DUF5106 domain-containing protein [Muribaculaceae bacterium]